MTHAGALLGQHLAIARVAAGYRTQEALAASIRTDRTVIAKAESGDRPPTAEVLARWLDACGVAGQLRAVMEGLAGIARVREGGPVKFWFSGYLEAEGKAHTIRIWQPTIIPGLIQTEAYARALFEAAGLDEDQVRALVGVRLGRQGIFSRAQPPNVIIVLDELVLHRLIGSPEVMREQLARLAELSKTIVIQIVPSEIGANSGLGGAITLAAGQGAAEVLLAESLIEDQVTTDAPLVLKASATFDAVRGEAVPRTASRTLISEARQKWNSR
jgi:transcriptional regulator with XRE-family HTH domain